MFFFTDRRLQQFFANIFFLHQAYPGDLMQKAFAGWSPLTVNQHFSIIIPIRKNFLQCVQQNFHSGNIRSEKNK
jgi:hypothetical protein